MTSILNACSNKRHLTQSKPGKQLFGRALGIFSLEVGGSVVRHILVGGFQLILSTMKLAWVTLRATGPHNQFGALGRDGIYFLKTQGAVR